MSASWTSFRIAQAIGVGGAAWLSGNIAALSLISVPALVRSHTQDSVPSGSLTRQWKYTFDEGKFQNPRIGAVITATYAYLAWSVRAGTPLSLLVRKNSIPLYGIAGLLTMGIIPYTIIFMSSTNNRLLSKAEQAVVSKDARSSVTEDDKEVGELLRKWTILNGIRSVLPLLGAAAAFAAVLT